MARSRHQNMSPKCMNQRLTHFTKEGGGRLFDQVGMFVTLGIIKLMLTRYTKIVHEMKDIKE